MGSWVRIVVYLNAAQLVNSDSKYIDNIYISMHYITEMGRDAGSLMDKKSKIHSGLFRVKSMNY